jgi:hypothetical protein
VTRSKKDHQAMLSAAAAARARMTPLEKIRASEMERRVKERVKAAPDLRLTPSIKAGNILIPADRVVKIDIIDLESERVEVETIDGDLYVAEGNDAIEAVMIFKPSAFEGRRMKWSKGAWAFHNLVGHPLMQLLAWMGFYRTAIWVHDSTAPKPISRAA